MKDPAFLFYTSDFLTGTVFMSNEQAGKYIRLLCAQHQHGGMLEKKSFLDAINGDEIVKNKFIETDDGFFNKRLMEEIEKRSHLSENMSKNAKVRWDKYKRENKLKLKCKSIAKAHAIAMQTEDEDIDINSSSSLVSKTSFNTKDLFKELINKYPNKDGSKKALQYILKTVKTEQDWKDINQALVNYLKSDRVVRGFVKNASTWFNNWRDWVNYEENERDMFKQVNRPTGIIYNENVKVRND